MLSYVRTPSTIPPKYDFDNPEDAIMEDTKQILVRLERRFKSFSQQQFIFVTALDRCRKIAFQPNVKIATISQVQLYADEVADNATDKRIFSIFLSLVNDLNEFRRTLRKIVQQKNDKKLNQMFATWKKVLETRHDISGVRAQMPHDHINHLSCDEAKNHFGGIVSLIPVAMTCARDVVERIEKTRAYRSNQDVTTDRQESRSTCCRSRTASSKRNGRLPTPLPPPKTTVEVEAQEEEAYRNGRPHGGWMTNIAQDGSVVSSPALSSCPSAAPSKENLPKASFRPSSHLSMSYKDEVKSRQRPKTSVAIQTPKFLAATCDTNLNWPHETVSESEMRKLLKSRQHCAVRPKWKP